MDWICTVDEACAWVKGCPAGENARLHGVAKREAKFWGRGEQTRANKRGSGAEERRGRHVPTAEMGIEEGAGRVDLDFNARRIDRWLKEKDAASEGTVRNQEWDELRKNGQGSSPLMRYKRVSGGLVPTGFPAAHANAAGQLTNLLRKLACSAWSRRS